MTIYKGNTLIAGGALPSQTGKAGKYLKTDGSNVSWEEVQAGGNVDDVKVDGTSVVTNKVANIDLTTKENVSNKTTTITSSSTDTQYPSAKATFDMGQDIREVAEGKTKSYVVSDITNPVFNSQADTIQLTGTFTDINDVVHSVTDLKLGDNFYVIETDVPDRWASNVQGAIPVVPEGYTQCEYIESNMNQYIYTGIKENTDWFDTLKVVIDGYYTQAGTANVGGYNNGGQFGQSGSVWSVETVQSTISSNVRRTVTQVLSEITDTDILYLGDIEIVRRNKGASFWTTDYPLFSAYTGGSTAPNYNPASFRMYSCKMYCDDVLVRNFVPAIRDNDGEIGLWDTVTETFFENGGTQPFTYAVLPDGVTLYKLETAKVPVTDVQVNGTTIINNTVANIPYPDREASRAGVVKVHSSVTGLDLRASDGIINLVSADDYALEHKTQKWNPRYGAVTSENIDKAIMEGLGNNSLTWTDTYKTNARNTIGAQSTSDNTLTTTDKTIVGAINELDARPSVPDVDNKTIDLNADDELQTFAVLNQNDTTKGLKEWAGNEQTFNALEEIDEDTLYFVYREITELLKEFYGYPLNIANALADNLLNWKLYGNSNQDGTPTPETPVEIKSVGDKTINLLNLTETKINTLNEAKIVTKPTYAGVNQGSVWTVGSNAIFGSNAYGIIIPCVQGDTYSINIFNTSALGTYIRSTYAEMNTSGIVTKGNNSYGRTGDTIVAENTGFLCIQFAVNTTQEAVENAQIMIVEGDTIPTSYIPYGYKIPITVSGKNMWNLGDFSVADSDTRTFEGLDPNKTYNISILASADFTTTSTAWSVSPRNADGSSRGNLLYMNDYVAGQMISRTFTGAYMLRMQIAKTDFNGTLYVMLTEGNVVPTSYEPYHESITPIYLNQPLAKVGTYADYIDYENQQVVRNVGIKVLDGTESWEETTYAYYVYENGLYDAHSDIGLCSHFICTNSSSSISGKFSFGGNTSSKNGNILFSVLNKYTSLNDFKSFLASEYTAGTPVIVVYPLATQTTEPFNVPDLTMAVGTNYITTNTEVSPSDAYAKAKVSQL